ncbi:helix-turn-helix domain-containing protein [Cerasicoccus arenae]|uniref:Transposase IS30-like HTH domain-containing protein n=1 Tax=Cerasicoccus arenae TaxID=424488 RepID=A0A8J3GED2_9BACT|nr:helix-turn-helix domain-containing protein [Cerasicoccus arenae]MBK1859237.1 helix-turn-helix domain-containing protein [Cerasicoccus arenae]GHC02779.1 hypothetical protein GCM10007047_19320 [Cerasicoccus arenae]
MPKKTYRRLRKADCNIIYRMRKVGNSQREIAYVLGCAQSTVSKELRRNRGLTAYRPKQAQQKSDYRQWRKRSREPVFVGELETSVR